MTYDTRVVGYENTLACWDKGRGIEPTLIGCVEQRDYDYILFR